jgi:hypothetical protein
MKLSENMMNFLGYLAENPPHWCDTPMAIGLAYPFGVKSAVNNGLIEPRNAGFGLTELGKEIGSIGVEMRWVRPRIPGFHVPFVLEAQAVLNRRQRQAA